MELLFLALGIVYFSLFLKTFLFKGGRSVKPRSNENDRSPRPVGTANVSDPLDLFVNFYA